MPAFRVEGELGHVSATKDEVLGNYTKCRGRQRFVKETGVSALAVMVERRMDGIKKRLCWISSASAFLFARRRKAAARAARRLRRTGRADPHGSRKQASARSTLQPTSAMPSSIRSWLRNARQSRWMCSCANPSMPSAITIGKIKLLGADKNPCKRQTPAGKPAGAVLSERKNPYEDHKAYVRHACGRYCRILLDDGKRTRPARAELLDYGAAIRSIQVPGQDRKVCRRRARL